MIQGFCIGGGLAVALTADLRIAALDSQFAIPAARLGLGYHFNGLKGLMDLVGPAYAREIMFTARRFSGEEALSMGLLNRAVPSAEVEALVRDYAAMIADNAPLTVKAAKIALRRRPQGPREARHGPRQRRHRRLLRQRRFQGGPEGVPGKAPAGLQRPLTDTSAKLSCRTPRRGV